MTNIYSLTMAIPNFGDLSRSEIKFINNLTKDGTHRVELRFDAINTTSRTHFPIGNEFFKQNEGVRNAQIWSITISSFVDPIHGAHHFAINAGDTEPISIRVEVASKSRVIFTQTREIDRSTGATFPYVFTNSRGDSLMQNLPSILFKEDETYLTIDFMDCEPDQGSTRTSCSLTVTINMEFEGYLAEPMKMRFISCKSIREPRKKYERICPPQLLLSRR